VAGFAYRPLLAMVTTLSAVKSGITWLSRLSPTTEGCRNGQPLPQLMARLLSLFRSKTARYAGVGAARVLLLALGVALHARLTTNVVKHPPSAVGVALGRDDLSQVTGTRRPRAGRVLVAIPTCPLAVAKRPLCLLRIVVRTAGRLTATAARTPNKSTAFMNPFDCAHHSNAKATQPASVRE
jgi:hypothetical protein